MLGWSSKEQITTHTKPAFLREYFLFIRYLFILGSQNVFLAAWAEKVKVNKFPSIRRILRNTGFYKLPGLPQRSQPDTLAVDLQNK
jgi:hypothetical protein